MDNITLDGAASPFVVKEKINELNSEKQANTLYFTNTEVLITAFVADTTYEDEGFVFRASVPLTGVLATYYPTVTLPLSVAISGNIASIQACYDGGIYIYAKQVPTETITISSIRVEVRG